MLVILPGKAFWSESPWVTDHSEPLQQHFCAVIRLTTLLDQGVEEKYTFFVYFASYLTALAGQDNPFPLERFFVLAKACPGNFFPG